MNSAASSSCLMLDIKELIPDANMRRRMSYVLRLGITTAMECLKTTLDEKVDAIITAMGLGCLADSEKFLGSIIDNGEQMLNPTPFIQSTFNTIGGQIALLTKNKGYNMTYSHRETSFEGAMLDALLLLKENDAKNVLLGAADEKTPTQEAIMQRMGAYRKGVQPSEGAHFFVIGSRPTAGCIAKIDGFYIAGEQLSEDFDVVVEAEKGYFTASAEALWKGIDAIRKGAKSALVINKNFKTTLRCI